MDFPMDMIKAIVKLSILVLFHTTNVTESIGFDRKFRCEYIWPKLTTSWDSVSDWLTDFPGLALLNLLLLPLACNLWYPPTDQVCKSSILVSEFPIQGNKKTEHPPYLYNPWFYYIHQRSHLSLLCSQKKGKMIKFRSMMHVDEKCNNACFPVILHFADFSCWF